LSKVVMWYVVCSLVAKTCCNRTKLSWKDVLWPTWVLVIFCVGGLVSVQIMSSIFDVTWHATACIYWHTIYIAFLNHVENDSMKRVMENILCLRYCGVCLFAFHDFVVIIISHIEPEAYKTYDPSGQTSMWGIGIFAFMLSRFLSYYYPGNENVALIWHYIFMPLYFSWWPNDTLHLNRPKKEWSAYQKSWPHNAATEQSIEARKRKERQWASYVFLPIATAICYYLSMFYCVLIFCMILGVFCRPKRAARAKSKSEKTEQKAQRKKTTTNRFFSLVHQHYLKIIGPIVCVVVVYFSYLLWHFYSEAGKGTIPEKAPDSKIPPPEDAQHDVSGMSASQKLLEAFWNTTHCIWEKITDFPDLYQNVLTATTKFIEKMVNSFHDKIEKATSALVDLFVNNAVNRMVKSCYIQDTIQQVTSALGDFVNNAVNIMVKSCYNWAIKAMSILESLVNSIQDTIQKAMSESERRKQQRAQCIKWCWNIWNWVAKWSFNQATNKWEPRDCLEQCNSPDE